MRQVFLSGQMVTESESKISIFDSGCKLGDTVTESTRTFGHRPFMPVRVLDLASCDLHTADEIFFTSTPYCIMPTTKFDGLPVGDGRVGAVTNRLLEAWSSSVETDIVGQATAQLQRKKWHVTPGLQQPFDVM